MFAAYRSTSLPLRDEDTKSSGIGVYDSLVEDFLAELYGRD